MNRLNRTVITMSKTKKMERLEGKKRKIQAFLAVAEMNDQDGRKKRLKPSSDSSYELKVHESSVSSKEEDKTDDKKPEKEVLSGDALDELRRKLRERKKKLQNIPDLRLKTSGTNASLELPEDMRIPLFIRDLQHFLLYVLLGTKAPIEPIK